MIFIELLRPRHRPGFRKKTLPALTGRALPVILLLVTSLLTVMAAAVQPVLAETPAEKLVITDDFSNPDSGWDISSDYTAAPTYTGKEYSIFVKMANLPVRFLNRKIGELSDFMAEVDIRETEPTKSGYVGILFRYQDNQNYYAFMINNSNRSFEIIRRMGERENPLQRWTTSNYIKPESATNRLKILCKGTQIEAYANGNKLCTVSDTTFTKGYLGFEVDTFTAPQTYLFSNLKVYRGVNAGFLTAESFRDSTLLEQRLQQARSDGFNISKIEYYQVGTKDFASAVKNLLSTGPTVIYVMCDRSERSTIKESLVSFEGEAIFDEVYYSNFLDFTLSQPVMSQPSYRGMDTVAVSAEINNAGLMPINRTIGMLHIIDPSGARIASRTSELKPVPSGTVSKIQLSTMLPTFLPEGDYSAELSITAYPDVSNDNMVQTKKTSTAFKVAGSTFAIFYVILPVIALITGAMIAWIFTRRKSRSQD
jgi:hypothetical protein